MKFECQESCGGKCCTAMGGVGAYVYLTEDDMMRIANHTQQNPSEFAALGEFQFTRFSKEPVRAWYLKDSEAQCRFFKDGRCGIHSVRPVACRTFPYWPEFRNPKNWEKLSEVCPGINKGDEDGDFTEQTEVDRQLRGASCNPGNNRRVRSHRKGH